MVARIFRLAILECDDPFPTIKDSHGSYGDVYRDFLAQALYDQALYDLGPRGDVKFQLSQWDVLHAQEYPRIDEVDGFLLTGSKHNAFDNDPWILKLVEFVKTVYTTTKKPVVGSCFGHQIIGRTLGGKVDVNPRGWELSVQEVHLNEEGQRLFGVSSLNLHQFHRDVVIEVPKGVVNLGSTATCSVQAMYEPGRILSFQGHPEFDKIITSKILGSRYVTEKLDDLTLADAKARARRPHSGSFLATKICEFMVTSQA